MDFQSKTFTFKNFREMHIHFFTVDGVSAVGKRALG
jgi:hypothetical protein